MGKEKSTLLRQKILIYTNDELEKSDSDKGTRIMPCSVKGISVLVRILIIVHWTKPIFRHEQ